MLPLFPSAECLGYKPPCYTIFTKVVCYGASTGATCQTGCSGQTPIYLQAAQDAVDRLSVWGFCHFVFLMRWSTSGEGVGVATQQAAERAIREKQHVEPTHFHIKPCDLMGSYSQTGDCSNSGKTNGDGFGESKFVSVEFSDGGLTRPSSST